MKLIRNFIAMMVIGATIFLASCADEDDPTGTGDARDKFVGTWTCNENSQQHGNSTYTMTISKAASPDQIIAKNFYQLGNSTSTVIIVDGNNMTIQTQIGNTTLSGSGSYSGGNLNFSFSADDGQTVDQVTVTAHH